MPRGTSTALSAAASSSASQRADEVFLQTLLMACAGLPVAEPPDDLDFWWRSDGDYTFVLMQGFKVAKDGSGKPVKRGYPSGDYPRRIMLELVTTAANTKSRMIYLPPVTTLMRRMGIKVSGGEETGSLPRFREQFERLVDSSIAVISNGDPSTTAKLVVPIAESFKLWVNRKEPRPAGYKEYVLLSQGFFNHVVRHHIPLDPVAIDKFGGRGFALKMDIYTWLLYRLHFLTEARLFDWEQLWSQFGLQLADTRQGRSTFRKKIMTGIETVLAEMPQYREHVLVDQAVGVTIIPLLENRLALASGPYSVLPEDFELTVDSTTSNEASPTGPEVPPGSAVPPQQPGPRL